MRQVFIAPDLGLLFLVDSYELGQILTPLRVEAFGYISRDDPVADLARAIISAGRGEMALPPPTATRALGQGVSWKDALIEPLSEREVEVLWFLAQGLTNKAIAQTLCLSVLTVKTHLHHIFGKLGVRSRTEAVLWATQHGYGLEDADWTTPRFLRQIHQSAPRSSSRVEFW